MFRAYKYLFYKLCFFERMMFDPLPGCTAFCFLLVLQFFNLFSVYLALNRFLGLSFPFSWSPWNFTYAVAVLVVPQYFFLIHGDRFRRVVREFNHESKRHSIIGGFIVGSYVVLSFVFFLWTVFLRPRNA